MKINDKIKKEYPWGPGRVWAKRTQEIAKILPDRAKVIDLGGGFCCLEKYIKNGEYISIDLKPWTDKTLVADFNRGQFPPLSERQFIICQGLFEYIKNPEKFLKRIKKYGKIMILTYLLAGTYDIGERKARMTAGEMEDMLKKTGWEIIFKKRFSEVQNIYYCTKQ